VRNIVATQLQRDGANGTHVGGNIFAGGAIATGRRLHQHAVFIENADRQAVQLQLAAVGQVIAAFQAILYALVEREEALFIKDVIQRQHRHFMADLAESASGAAPTRWVGESGVISSGC
jgi:pantothenate kinase type III